MKGDYNLGDKVEVTINEATLFDLRATPNIDESNKELIQIGTSLT